MKHKVRLALGQWLCKRVYVHTKVSKSYISWGRLNTLQSDVQADLLWVKLCIINFPTLGKIIRFNSCKLCKVITFWQMQMSYCSFLCSILSEFFSGWRGNPFCWSRRKRRKRRKGRWPQTEPETVSPSTEKWKKIEALIHFEDKSQNQGAKSFRQLLISPTTREN